MLYATTGHVAMLIIRTIHMHGQNRLVLEPLGLYDAMMATNNYVLVLLLPFQFKLNISLCATTSNSTCGCPLAMMMV